jgi:hypothetical protein
MRKCILEPCIVRRCWQRPVTTLNKRRLNSLDAFVQMHAMHLQSIQQNISS